MLLLFLFDGTEFLAGFSSVDWFSMEFQVFASIFIPRNGIPSCFSSAEWFGTEFRPRGEQSYDEC